MVEKHRFIERCKIAGAWFMCTIRECLPPHRPRDSDRLTTEARIDRPDARPLYCFFALAQKNGLACLAPARGRRVIPDAATVLARLNFRKSETFREHMSSVKATQLRPGMVIKHEG